MIWHSDQTCFEQMTINSESNMGNKSLCLEHNLLLGSRAMTWSGSNLFLQWIKLRFLIFQNGKSTKMQIIKPIRDPKSRCKFFFTPFTLVSISTANSFDGWTEIFSLVKWNSNLRNCSELELMRDIMEM